MLFAADAAHQSSVRRVPSPAARSRFCLWFIEQFGCEPPLGLRQFHHAYPFGLLLDGRHIFGEDDAIERSVHSGASAQGLCIVGRIDAVVLLVLRAHDGRVAGVAPDNLHAADAWFRDFDAAFAWTMRGL